jgi:hypothetical protein
MSNVEIISNNVIEVSIEPSPVVDIEVFNGGVIVGTNLSLQYQLILGRLASQPQLYREFTYINDSLTGIDAWATSNKIIKIFEIRFTYTGSNLTQKTLRDIQSNRILTVNFTYTDGNLTSINEVFS